MSKNKPHLDNAQLAALRQKYAAINAQKEADRVVKKGLKAILNYVEKEDQSHYRDIDGHPLDHEKYSSIRGTDCWFTWDDKKKRWKRIPL